MSPRQPLARKQEEADFWANLFSRCAAIHASTSGLTLVPEPIHWQFEFEFEDDFLDLASSSWLSPNPEGDSPQRRRGLKGQNGFEFGVV